MKWALGPLLALIPILVWEFSLKPARVRRNAALGLIAEIDLNLLWILRLIAKRTTDKTGLTVNPSAKTLVVSSHASVLGELPPELLPEVLRFYAMVEDVVATIDKLHAMDTERVGASAERRHELTEDMRRGHRSLDNNLPAIINVGDEIRTLLHATAQAVSFMSTPPLLPLQSIVDTAVRSDVARRSADGTVPGTS